MKRSTGARSLRTIRGLRLSSSSTARRCQGCARPSGPPSGSTGGADRWCSRSSRAAKVSASRRSTHGSSASWRCRGGVPCWCPSPKQSTAAALQAGHPSGRRARRGDGRCHAQNGGAGGRAGSRVPQSCRSLSADASRASNHPSHWLAAMRSSNGGGRSWMISIGWENRGRPRSNRCCARRWSRPVRSDER